MSGSVSIGTAGSAMTVTQGSDKAIINWNGFSIGQGNSINFVQPNASSAILNRVTGSTNSTIAGSITGNGQVYLINPNGIAITSTGSVAVGGGFVASTLDISNDDFLKGQYNFNGNGSSAGVSNEGIITIGRGGYAALIGGTVKNDGLIAVPLGKVGLGSGEQATLDLSGDGFLQVALPTKAGAKGDSALIENSGSISAEGGTVVMKAATARNAARHAVNLSGSVEANSISGSDGEIVIGGGEGGNVTVSGKVSAKSSTIKGGKITVSGKSVVVKGATIDASGTKGGDVRVSGTDVSIDATVQATGGTQSGGTIVVTGDNITLGSSALLNASGATGGVVLVGGDYQGGYNAATKFLDEEVATADTVTVGKGATIKVDGTAGAGGKAVVWSDDTTIFDGIISATGAGSASGGLVETSGHNLALGDNVSVSTLSGSGTTGTWLIDPYNVTISSAASSGVSLDSAPNPWQLYPNSSGANFNSATLSSYLAQSNVAITTNSGAGSEAGNITVSSSVSWSAATTLSLLADSSTGGVFINASVTGLNSGSGLVLSAGSGGISQAGGTVIRAGTLTANAANGGSVALTNTGNLIGTLGSSSSSGAFAITNGQALTVSGSITSNGTLSLTTTSGNLTINAALTDSNTNSDLSLSSAGNLIITKNITQSGTNASVTLAYAGSYSLTNGARISLPDSGAALTINGQVYALIHDVSDLQAIGSTGFYAVANDIDASTTASWNSGAGFAPIGSSTAFSGTLTGLGHNIDSLTINRSGTTFTGLFAKANAATLRDMTLSNISITGSGRVGGLVGQASNSTLSNIHVTGSVNAYQEAGGIAGWFADSTLSNSSSAVSVTVSANGAGGLVGYAVYTATISDSYATGAVKAASNAGGLVGQALGGPLSLTDVYASGSITATTNAGGLIGVMDSGSVTLTDAYWDANSTGQAAAVAALASFSSSSSTTGTAVDVSNAPRTQATYTGLDFTNTWVMIDGDTRPMLRSEYSTVIATAAALQLMSLDLSATYTLGANIDMTSALAAGSNGYYGGLWGASGFKPIGNGSSQFTGSFDGSGHTITGLTINRSSTDYVGLFGYTNGATIANITLTGGSVIGNDNVGSLVGYLNGGSVSSASASTTVSAQSTLENNAGGLIGAVDAGAVSNSSASGSVTGAGYGIGGLVGYLVNSGTITQSYATGAVTGTSTSYGYIGGFVGANGYSSSLGQTGGTISQSYSTGTVTGSSGRIGGFVGYNEGTITDSYATGRVIGASATYVGGFVGMNYIDGTITNAYSTGYVTGTTNVGGFAGANSGLSSAFTSVYWDTQTSGLTIGVGSGSGSATARTTAQLQGSLQAGFSSSIWGTGTNLYPYLKWNYSTTPVAVSGTVYSDAGSTTLSGATVTGVSGGTSFGSTTSGANGYYYILTTSSSLSASGVITYIDNGTTKGAAFSDVGGVNGVQGVTIYGAAAHLITSQSTLSTTRTNYLSARGSYADTDLAFLSSSSFSPLTTTTGYGIYLSTTGSYTLNTNLGSSGLLKVESGGTLGVSGAITLSVAGTLTIADSVSWSDASSLTLATTNSGDISLGGAVTATSGTLVINATGTATSSSAVNVGTFNLAGGTWSQVAATLPGFSASNFATGSSGTFLRATGGDGSTSTPYQIADIYGLQGIGSSGLLSQNFVLANDIDASGTANWNSGAGFNPIGISTAFTGSLDGDGYEISGLFIDRPTDTAGLFSAIGSAGSVSNLIVSGASVTGLSAGILAGTNNGTISNVATSGSVSNTTAGTSGNLGGLVGINLATISGSTSSATVNSASTTEGTAGGLVGRSDGGTVSNSYATGSVTGYYGGGLIGYNDATVSNSYSTGTVTSSGYNGGLIGYNDGTVSGSFWNSTTSGTSLGIGAGTSTGIVGLSTAQMSALSTFTGAGWSIDDAGGTSSIWRIYDGYTMPLLRSFMTSLTVTSGSATKTYDGSATSSSTGTLTYGTPGYDTSLVSGTAIYTASSADVGTYNGSSLTLSGLYSSQFGYDITFVSGSLTVNQRAITVTADAKSMVYGDGTPTLSYQITSGSLAGNDSLSGALATTATATSNVGSYAITQNTLASSNYDITYVGANVSVNAATLTIIAANGSMTYGNTVPALGYSVSGWKNGQSDSLLSGVMVSTNATSSSPAGTAYVTMASGGSLSAPADGNYVLAYVDGHFSIANPFRPSQGASASVLADSSSNSIPSFPMQLPQTINYSWETEGNVGASAQGGNSNIMSVESQQLLNAGCSSQGSAGGACSVN